MGLGVGFPQRLVAEKVTSTVCPWKIYLTCPLIGQVALISTGKKKISLEFWAVLGSLTCLPVGTWNVHLRPQSIWSACLCAGGWRGLWLGLPFLTRAQRALFASLCCAHNGHEDTTTLECLSTPLLLWQYVIALSMSTRCSKKTIPEKLCWETGRCEEQALGAWTFVANFWVPGKNVAYSIRAFLFFFFSCGIETKMHTKADHLAHKSSFEMGWANAPCRYRHIICKNLFCPLPSFTVAFKIILFQRKSQLVCQFVLYSYV